VHDSADPRSLALAAVLVPDELWNAARPTTLLDFVYELRRRADYEHIDQYIAATSDAAIERFHAGVLFLADSGLLLVEAQLAAYTDALRQTAADWAASTVGALGAWAAAPVRDRIKVIAACGHA
jgi:hypothetical protein